MANSKPATIIRKLSAGAHTAKKLVDNGLQNKIEDLFAIRRDARTGYYFSDATVRPTWGALIPIIEEMEDIGVKVAALNRLINYIPEWDESARAELKIAVNKRLRDDFKTVVLLGANYNLNHALLVKIVTRAEIPTKKAPEEMSLRQLLELLPTEFLAHIDEMTFAIRSVLVDVGKRVRRGTSSGPPTQESLRLMDRRLAGVCGADYLFLLTGERVLTSKRQIKLHLELIKAHNNPRWRQIEGTEAGTLKSRITKGNPMFAILRSKTKDRYKLPTLNLGKILRLPSSGSPK